MKEKKKHLNPLDWISLFLLSLRDIFWRVDGRDARRIFKGNHYSVLLDGIQIVVYVFVYWYPIVACIFLGVGIYNIATGTYKSDISYGLSMIWTAIALLVICTILFCSWHKLWYNIRFWKSAWWKNTNIGANRIRRDKTKSLFGEYMATMCVEQNMKNHGVYGKVFNNVIVPKRNGDFTEIDILAVTTHGIWSIEAKGRMGVFNGNLTDQYWTQIIGQQQNTLENPLMQNWNHINFLVDYIYENLPEDNHMKKGNLAKYFLNIVLFAVKGASWNVNGEIQAESYFMGKAEGTNSFLRQNVHKTYGIELSREDVDLICGIIDEIAYIPESKRQAMISNRQLAYSQGKFASHYKYFAAYANLPGEQGEDVSDFILCRDDGYYTMIMSVDGPFSFLTGWTLISKGREWNNLADANRDFELLCNMNEDSEKWSDGIATVFEKTPGNLAYDYAVKQENKQIQPDAEGYKYYVGFGLFEDQKLHHVCRENNDGAQIFVGEEIYNLNDGGEGYPDKGRVWRDLESAQHDLALLESVGEDSPLYETYCHMIYGRVFDEDTTDSSPADSAVHDSSSVSSDSSDDGQNGGIRDTLYMPLGESMHYGAIRMAQEGYLSGNDEEGHRVVDPDGAVHIYKNFFPDFSEKKPNHGKEVDDWGNEYHENDFKIADSDRESENNDYWEKYFEKYISLVDRQYGFTPNPNEGKFWDWDEYPDIDFLAPNPEFVMSEWASPDEKDIMSPVNVATEDADDDWDDDEETITLEEARRQGEMLADQELASKVTGNVTDGFRLQNPDGEWHIYKTPFVNFNKRPLSTVFHITDGDRWGNEYHENDPYMIEERKKEKKLGINYAEMFAQNNTVRQDTPGNAPIASEEVINGNDDDDYDDDWDDDDEMETITLEEARAEGERLAREREYQEQEKRRREQEAEEAAYLAQQQEEEEMMMMYMEDEERRRRQEEEERRRQEEEERRRWEEDRQFLNDYFHRNDF